MVISCGNLYPQLPCIPVTRILLITLSRPEKHITKHSLSTCATQKVLLNPPSFSCLDMILQWLTIILNGPLPLQIHVTLNISCGSTYFGACSSNVAGVFSPDKINIKQLLIFYMTAIATVCSYVAILHCNATSVYSNPIQLY